MYNCNNHNKFNSSKSQPNHKVSHNQLKFSDHPLSLLNLLLSCSLHLWIHLKLFKHLSCNQGSSDNHLAPTPLVPQHSLQILFSNLGKSSSLQIKLNGSNSQHLNSSNQLKSLSHKRLKSPAMKQARNENQNKTIYSSFLLI